MEAIYLPSITGQFGNWRYYQVIFTVKHLTEILGYKKDKSPIYRVKTVDEVDEIYSSSINDMLQRTFDPKRLDPIKNYLIKQNDKYVNNITIAIFGGEPEWLPIGLKSNSIEFYKDESDETISKAFGVIKLSGKEVLFVLDGQHRIKGLREGVLEDNSLESQEIAVTLVSHNPSKQGKEKTRRLFTTVNRYAKPVSLGESILLDEDDLSSIIVRKLIEEYPKFKGKDIIALNKTANLNLPTDSKRFSTVITLYNINETLIDNKSIYPKYDGPKKNLVRVRPADEIIDVETKRITKYWDDFFKFFPKAEKFVKDPQKNQRIIGGAYSLRPIGQLLYNDFYLKSKNSKIPMAKFSKIPDDLENPFWEYILWNPSSKTITGTKAFARNYVYYHLGISLTSAEKKSLLENYRKFRNDEKASLPKPQFT
jgi:DNA sulfur modification protein DndB